MNGLENPLSCSFFVHLFFSSKILFDACHILKISCELLLQLTVLFVYTETMELAYVECHYKTRYEYILRLINT